MTRRTNSRIIPLSLSLSSRPSRRISSRGRGGEGLPSASFSCSPDSWFFDFSNRVANLLSPAFLQLFIACHALFSRHRKSLSRRQHVSAALSGPYEYLGKRII